MASAPSPDAQVLILGGGIGGLTLGAILRKLNISFLILERNEIVEPVGAGISLAPNCMRVLDQLGLYEDIQREAQPMKGILVHRDSVKWKKLDFTCVESTFGYPVYSAERHWFHHLLYEAAGGPQNVLYKAKVVDIVDDPASAHVRVVAADGRQFRGDVVVGADGIRSVTRRVLARESGMTEANTIKFTGRVHMSGYTAPLKNLGEEELGVANWLFYDNATLTTWPCKDNRQWFIGVTRADSPQGVDGDRSVWNDVTPKIIAQAYGNQFHPFAETGRFEEIVNQSERVVASNVFQEVDFPAMTKGRVALLGDAAHSMTSFFGQGACQAIEDATELANALHGHLSDPDGGSLETALGAYGSTRGERAKALVSFSNNFAKVHMAMLPYGLGPLVRKLVYAYLPEWGWMRGLQWLYGYQPKVDALPDHTTGDGSVPNLYQRFGEA